MTEVEEPEETQLTESFLLYVGNNLGKGIPDCRVSSPTIHFYLGEKIFSLVFP